MIKYRLRLTNGRIIGPYTLEQLEEYSLDEDFSQIDDCQEYPLGDWKPIRQMDFYSKLQNKKASASLHKQDETFVIDLAELKKSQLGQEPLPELPREELTETIRISQPKPILETELPKPAHYDPRPEHTLTEMKSNDDTGFDYREEDRNIDRTTINPNAQKELEALKKKEQYEALVQARIEIEKKRKIELEEQARQHALRLQEAERNKPQDEATQIISLDNEKTSLIIISENAEKHIYKDEMLLENLKDQEEVYQEERENKKEEVLSSPVKSNRKKLVLIGTILSLALLYVMPDNIEKQASYKYLSPQIVFPIPFDQADKNKSAAEFQRGLKSFSEATYPSIIQSGISFKNAYEQDVTNLPALNFLFRAYSEQLQYSKEIGKDSLTVFNILLGKKPYLQQNPNGVIGLSYFYRSIGKVAAANSAIEQHLNLEKKQVTQDLFAVYVMGLIEEGKMDKAREFYRAILKAPQKNKYSYEAIIQYLILNEEIDKAQEFLDEAIRLYPKVVGFHLTKAKLYYNQKKYKEATKSLKESEALGLENNDLNRAKFLELSGLLTALQGNDKAAIQLLKNALSLKESDELRLKISDLNLAKNKPEAQKLIDQSKAIKFLIQAKEFYENKNFDMALSYAAKATEAFPGHIPSSLFLAKVQLKLGLVNQSISNLENLLTKYPEAHNIQVQLIQTYIDTYKINDARTKLAQIPANTINTDFEFSSLMGKMYLKKNDPLQAISWLKQAINLNPLSDKDIFVLAELFLKKSSFKSAKELLNKCIDLDPSNLDYRIAYSKILYETEDDQAAIGYLLSLLEEFKDNPKLLSEIAIFYYRTGKIKDFELYKKKIEDLPFKDKALYEFLIRSALLDERYLEIPGYVEELLKIEPSDIESMMTAGKVLFEENKFEEASKWFLRVQEKMSTYPKVLYYISKIRFLAKEYDLALTEIQKDIKINGENDESLVLLSQIYLYKDDIVQAENMLKKAQKLNPKSYDAIVGLADISVKRNNLDLALDLYNRAIKQRPGESIIHKKLGDVYRLLGQGALAIEAYKMYLELEPDSPDKDKIDSYIQIMQ